MKRTRLRPSSANRIKENTVRARLLEATFGERGEWLCQFNAYRIKRWDLHRTPTSSCFGAINGHEILKRSRGGSITDMENVTLLCDFHNRYVEDHPHAAALMGLAKHSWDVS